MSGPDFVTVRVTALDPWPPPAFTTEYLVPIAAPPIDTDAQVCEAAIDWLLLLKPGMVREQIIHTVVVSRNTQAQRMADTVNYIFKENES